MVSISSDWIDYGDSPREKGEITKRDSEMLQLAATGATNLEIGLRLGIGEYSVRNRMGPIYRKLGTTSRVEAILEAIRRGYIVVDGIRATNGH